MEAWKEEGGRREEGGREGGREGGELNRNLTLSYFSRRVPLHILPILT